MWWESWDRICTCMWTKKSGATIVSFKISQPIFMILLRFNAVLFWSHPLIQSSSNFSNKVAHLAKVNNSDLAIANVKGMYKVFSRTGLHKLPIKIYCRSMSKDGKISWNSTGPVSLIASSWQLRSHARHARLARMSATSWTCQAFRQGCHEDAMRKTLEHWTTAKQTPLVGNVNCSVAY